MSQKLASLALHGTEILCYHIEWWHLANNVQAPRHKKKTKKALKARPNSGTTVLEVGQNPDGISSSRYYCIDSEIMCKTRLGGFNNRQKCISHIAICSCWHLALIPLDERVQQGTTYRPPFLGRLFLTRIESTVLERASRFL